MSYPRVSTFKNHEQFLARLGELGHQLPCDAELQTGPQAPLEQPLSCSWGTVGNRWCILPMEGWDGTEDGRPTDLTRRRWTHFGLSGAKLIWGGEAVAVRHDGRANPNQLTLTDRTANDIEALGTLLRQTHREHFGSDDDLLLGLQLTHSGRFCRPNEKSRLEPRTAYRHPILDPRFGIEDDSALLSDDDLARLADEFIAAARTAQQMGFAFVDVKHCHGYLGHELLSGYDRPGKYGGSFENRTRFFRDIATGIRAEAPGLHIGTRLSIFDFTPFEPGDDGTGIPTVHEEYRYAFGGTADGAGIDLDEPSRFLDFLADQNIDLVCTTAGSPYYNPHIQRPALFPPSDGYQPPEDPLVGVARQIRATADLKARHPNAVLVGSGYSYLQEWLPHVGQAVVREGAADAIGLGRMVLSYPDLPADVSAGRPLTRKKICRTFSDCTTGPRNGMISGCFPLDPFYKEMPERTRLVELKKAKAIPGT